ncbi:MAG TPA: hypothetical protein VMR33_05240 [Candidatus Baltobacteraceae bacterium]|jgi:hypothetical protein|nr:hypothetical protein [Candidatus Baltobacteraceae bacterium]
MHGDATRIKDRSRNYPLLLASQFLSAFGDNLILMIILGPFLTERRLGKTIATQNGLENLAMLGGALIAFLDIKIGFNPSELLLAMAAFVAVVVIWLKIPGKNPAPAI